MNNEVLTPVAIKDAQELPEEMVQTPPDLPPAPEPVAEQVAEPAASVPAPAPAPAIRLDRSIGDRHKTCQHPPCKACPQPRPAGPRRI